MCCLLLRMLHQIRELDDTSNDINGLAPKLTRIITLMGNRGPLVELGFSLYNPGGGKTGTMLQRRGYPWISQGISLRKP